MSVLEQVLLKFRVYDCRKMSQYPRFSSESDEAVEKLRLRQVFHDKKEKRFN